MITCRNQDKKKISRLSKTIFTRMLHKDNPPQLLWYSSVGNLDQIKNKIQIWVPNDWTKNQPVGNLERHIGHEALLNNHLTMQWEWYTWEQVVAAASDPTEKSCKQIGQHKASFEAILSSILTFLRHGIGGLQACKTWLKGFSTKSHEISLSSSTWIPVMTLKWISYHGSRATTHTNIWSASQGNEEAPRDMASISWALAVEGNLMPMLQSKFLYVRSFKGFNKSSPRFTWNDCLDLTGDPSCDTLTTMNSIVIPLASNSNGSTQGAAKSFMILCLWYCSSCCLVEARGSERDF